MSEIIHLLRFFNHRKYYLIWPTNGSYFLVLRAFRFTIIRSYNFHTWDVRQWNLWRENYANVYWGHDKNCVIIRSLQCWFLNLQAKRMIFFPEHHNFFVNVFFFLIGIIRTIIYLTFFSFQTIKNDLKFSDFRHKNSEHD